MKTTRGFRKLNAFDKFEYKGIEYVKLVDTATFNAYDLEEHKPVFFHPHLLVLAEMSRDEQLSVMLGEEIHIVVAVDDTIYVKALGEMRACGGDYELEIHSGHVIFAADVITEINPGAVFIKQETTCTK